MEQALHCNSLQVVSDLNTCINAAKEQKIGLP